MLAFLSWWLVIQIFGLAALPLVRQIFSRLPDQGYAFSKAAGLLLVSYLLWAGASSGLLINEAGGVMFALLAVAALSTWAGFRNVQSTLRSRLTAYWREHRANILLVEILFLLAFAGWTLVRAYTPAKILPLGGEKYMEIAFLNGVLNSPIFPPLDPWMAGYGIAYYYFGYIMMAVMVETTGTAATVGFDLYDALLFALTAISAYGIVSNLIRASGGSRRAAGGFGLLGALFTVGIGSLEGLLEGLYSSHVLPDSFWSWLSIPDLANSVPGGSFYPGHGWWWWRASRVLQDLDLFYQPIIYQPIDEFPFFSFLLGDNHPHKLALPFVLLAAGAAFNTLMHAREMSPVKTTAFKQAAEEMPDGLTGWRKWAVKAGTYRAQIGPFLFNALVLGGLAFLNTWDFPILLGLIALAYALGSWQRLLELQRPPEHGTPARKVAVATLIYALALGVSSIALYPFFYIGFSSQAGGILPYVFPPTRLPQYLVMFGPFLFILAAFAVLANLGAYRERSRSAWSGAAWTWLWLAVIIVSAFLLVLLVGTLALNGSESMRTIEPWLGGMSFSEALLRILQVKAANPWLFLILSAVIALAVSAVWHSLSMQDQVETRAKPDSAAQFALLMALAGLGLTLAVEFFYLRDNFGLRMNTVFKFYFQGWVLMACASAYAVWWTASRIQRPLWRVVFLTTAALLTAAGLVYPIMGIVSRTEGFSNKPNLDAAATFTGFYPGSFDWAAQPDDYAAVQWLRQNGRLPDGSVPTILEAGSGGYEIAGRISAFTGYPTLLGWTNHEGQWRGTQAQIDERQPVIRAIYTTPSAQTTLELLRSWNVDYVVLGNIERQYISTICGNPETPCQVSRALEKFSEVLKPVFSQGGTTLYRVPKFKEPAR